MVAASTTTATLTTLLMGKLSDRAHPKVKGHQNKVALTCDPLVYWLESPGNPGVDLFLLCLDPGSIEEFAEGGAIKLRGWTRTGKPLIFVPYYSWGNRGPSQMTVWVNT